MERLCLRTVIFQNAFCGCASYCCSHSDTFPGIVPRINTLLFGVAMGAKLWQCMRGSLTQLHRDVAKQLSADADETYA